MTLIHLPLAALCLIGFLLASYAYSVEMRADEARRMGTAYKAYCDIGPFSCTKVFSSEFGYITQFFGLPPLSNAVLGMLFYLTEACCCWSPDLVLLLSGVGLAASAGFAYILFVILREFCVVCCSVYLVNVSTAIVAYRWWGRRQASEEARQATAKRD